MWALEYGEGRCKTQDRHYQDLSQGQGKKEGRRAGAPPRSGLAHPLLSLSGSRLFQLPPLPPQQVHPRALSSCFQLFQALCCCGHSVVNLLKG